MPEARRNVVVTGGSRGLGLGIAKKLVTAGYLVIAIARQKNAQLAAAMREADEGHAGSLHFVPFDLAKIEDIPQLVRGIRKVFGPIYGLVNNAGVGSSGALAAMPNAQIEQLLRVNTLSPAVLTKYVVRSMMAEGAGRVINIASVAAFAGYSGLSVYSATKASMIGFTRALAREVGPLGITVNAVAPGFIETEMTEGLRKDQRNQVIRRSALRRLPDVEDVANAVAFLLGETGKNISGTVLAVDAGSTA
jgi:3-oxoacyl-[acyl-carrier protein] reductase